MRYEKVKLFFVLMMCFFSLRTLAVSDSLKSNLTYNAYLESYYSYDFGNPSYSRPRLYVNHHKHNEIAINLALLKVSYTPKNFRANLGLMTGTYSEKNFSYRDEKYHNIYELNAGLKLSKHKNIWFDIGILPSHIGFESPIGMESWTLTRSILAEGSPYYESAARLSYTTNNNKLYASILVLNGWQQINKYSNYPLSIGHQITYKPTESVTINSSSFLGNNGNYYYQNRYFHNFYTQIQWNKKIGTILGFDIGSEKYSSSNNSYQIWYSPIAIARYTINNNNTIAIRTEYFNDYWKKVIPTDYGSSFKCWGFSMNYDHKINQYGTFRIEGKKLQSKTAVFKDQNGFSKNNYAVTAALIFNLYN